MTPEQQQIIDKYRAKFTQGMGEPSQEEDTSRLVEKAKIAKQTIQQQKTGFVADIKGIGTGIKESATKAQEKVNQIQASEASPLRKLVQTLGQSAGLVSNVIGETVMGGVKALTPEAIQKPFGQAVQTGVQAVGQTQLVQDLISSYQNLPPEKQRDIDAILGFGSLGLDVAGAGLLKKGATAVAPTLKGAVKTGMETTGEVGLKTLSKISKKTGIAPENIMQRVARVTPTAQKTFKDVSGETVGEFLVKRKIFGNDVKIAEQLVDKFQKNKTLVDKEISKLTGNYNPRPVKTALEQLREREVSVSAPGAKSPTLTKIIELNNKFDKEGLTMSDINEVKRLYERSVKLDFIKQNLPKEVAKSNNIDNAIRNWQLDKAEELGLLNLRELNKETRSLKTLADALDKKIRGSEANNAVSLTDWIVLAGGDPTAVASFLGKKAISSKTLQSKIAKFLSRNKNLKVIKAQKGKRKPTLKDFLTR